MNIKNKLFKAVIIISLVNSFSDAARAINWNWIVHSLARFVHLEEKDKKVDPSKKQAAQPAKVKTSPRRYNSPPAVQSGRVAQGRQNSATKPAPKKASKKESLRESNNAPYLWMNNDPLGDAVYSTEDEVDYDKEDEIVEPKKTRKKFNPGPQSKKRVGQKKKEEEDKPKKEGGFGRFYYPPRNKGEDKKDNKKSLGVDSKKATVVKSNYKNPKGKAVQAGEQNHAVGVDTQTGDESIPVPPAVPEFNIIPNPPPLPRNFLIPNPPQGPEIVINLVNPPGQNRERERGEGEIRNRLLGGAHGELNDQGGQVRDGGREEIERRVIEQANLNIYLLALAQFFKNQVSYLNRNIRSIQEDNKNLKNNLWLKNFFNLMLLNYNRFLEAKARIARADSNAKIEGLKKENIKANNALCSKTGEFNNNLDNVQFELRQKEQESKELKRNSLLNANRNILLTAELSRSTRKNKELKEANEHFGNSLYWQENLSSHLLKGHKGLKKELNQKENEVKKLKNDIKEMIRRSRIALNYLTQVLAKLKDVLLEKVIYLRENQNLKAENTKIGEAEKELKSACELKAVLNIKLINIVKKAKKEIKKLKDDLEEIKKKLKESSEKISTFTSSANSATMNLAKEFQKKFAAFEKKMSKLKEILATHVGAVEIKSSEDIAGVLDNCLKNTRKEVEELKGQLKAKKEELIEKAKRGADKNSSLANLQKKIKSLQDALSKAQRDKENSKNIDNQHKSLANELENTKKALSKFKEEAQNSKNEAKKALEDANKIAQKAQDESKAKVIENNKLRSEIAGLNGQIKKANSEKENEFNSKFNALVQEYQSKLDQLKKNWQKELEAANKNNAELSKKNRKIVLENAELLDVDNKLKAKESALEKAKTANAVLSKEKSSIVKENEKLLKDHNKLQQDYEALRKQKVTESTKWAAKCSKENKALKAKIEKLKRKNQTIKELKVLLEKAHEKLASSEIELKDRIRTIEKEKDELMPYRVDFDARIEDFKKDCCMSLVNVLNGRLSKAIIKKNKKEGKKTKEELRAWPVKLIKEILEGFKVVALTDAEMLPQLEEEENLTIVERYCTKLKLIEKEKQDEEYPISGALGVLKKIILYDNKNKKKKEVLARTGFQDKHLTAESSFLGLSKFNRKQDARGRRSMSGSFKIK